MPVPGPSKPNSLSKPTKDSSSGTNSATVVFPPLPDISSPPLLPPPANLFTHATIRHVIESHGSSEHRPESVPVSSSAAPPRLTLSPIATLIRHDSIGSLHPSSSSSSTGLSPPSSRTSPSASLQRALEDIGRNSLSIEPLLLHLTPPTSKRRSSWHPQAKNDASSGAFASSSNHPTHRRSKSSPRPSHDSARNGRIFTKPHLVEFAVSKPARLSNPSSIFKDVLHLHGPIRVHALHGLSRYKKVGVLDGSDSTIGSLPDNGGSDDEKNSMEGRSKRTSLPAVPRGSTSSRQNRPRSMPSGPAPVPQTASGSRFVERGLSGLRNQDTFESIVLAQSSPRSPSQIVPPRGILKSSPSNDHSNEAGPSRDRRRITLSLQSPASTLPVEAGGPLPTESTFQTLVNPPPPSSPAPGSTINRDYSRSGTPSRRGSITSRFSAGGSSIPIRAIVSPRPPSAISRYPTPVYHLHDPTFEKRFSMDGTSSHFVTAESELGWWRRLPLQGWCFLIGFGFPPAWWYASVVAPRRVVFTRTRHNGLLEEWNQADQDALLWRFRCRLASLLTLCLYVVILVLAVVFAR